MPALDAIIRAKQSVDAESVTRDMKNPQGSQPVYPSTKSLVELPVNGLSALADDVIADGRLARFDMYTHTLLVHRAMRAIYAC
jgi:hypothetical protein